MRPRRAAALRDPRRARVLTGAPTQPQALVRSHLAHADNRWMPATVRATGTFVTSIFLLLSVCLIIAIFVLFAHFRFFVGYVVALAATTIPAAYVAGDRVARVLMRRRMRRITEGTALLPSHSDDGTLVRFRGRVRSRATLDALVSERPVVYSKLVFAVGAQRAVHERAVDFLLDDGSGSPVAVIVDEARLIPRDRDDRGGALPPAVLDRLLALAPAAEVREIVDDWMIDRKRGVTHPVRGLELAILDGDEVEVVGLRRTIVDQTVSSRLERDVPLRAAIAGSREMPLLISRLP